MEAARKVYHAELRAARRAKARAQNEPPRLTLGEEVFNAVSHGAGGLLAVAATVLLLLRSHTGMEVLATCFYGISMTVMMFMSGVYHAMPTGSTAKRVLRRFDYTSIYLLVYKGGRVGITIFCIQWGVILFGVTMVAIFGPGRWRALHFTLYFLIGWSGLMFIPDFYANARPLLWLILAGGLVYTLGMIPFVRSRKYDHCIWHVFVLAAAALHWVGIYTQIYT